MTNHSSKEKETAMEKGQRVFTANGDEVELIAEVAGEGFAVWRLVYDDDDEACRHGECPIVVGQVYATPPTTVKEERIAQLVAQERELRDQVNELRREKEQLRAEAAKQDGEHAALLARLKRHAALARIDDVLEGRVTHFVKFDEHGRVSVQTIKEALDREEGGGPDKWRLLSLYGGSKGDLEWRINQYRDGSGGYSLAWPFCGEEDAIALAREKTVEAMEKAWTERNSWKGWHALESAERFGVEPHQALLAFCRASRREALHNSVVAAQERLREAEEALAALESP